MAISRVFIAIASGCFLLAAFGVSVPVVDLPVLGLMFFAAGHII